MVAMFAEVVKKILNRNPSDRSTPMKLWYLGLYGIGMYGANVVLFCTPKCLIHIFLAVCGCYYLVRFL